MDFTNFLFKLRRNNIVMKKLSPQNFQQKLNFLESFYRHGFQKYFTLLGNICCGFMSISAQSNENSLWGCTFAKLSREISDVNVRNFCV